MFWRLWQVKYFSFSSVPLDFHRIVRGSIVDAKHSRGQLITKIKWKKKKLRDCILCVWLLSGYCNVTVSNRMITEVAVSIYFVNRHNHGIRISRRYSHRKSEGVSFNLIFATIKIPLAHSPKHDSEPNFRTCRCIISHYYTRPVIHRNE